MTYLALDLCILQMASCCRHSEEVDSPCNAGGKLPDIPSVERTKQRRLDLDFVSELPVCYVTNGKSPKLESSGPSMLWLLIRILSSKQDQEVPGRAGFLSAAGEKPKCLTTADYYPVTNHPITEYKTVQ